VLRGILPFFFGSLFQRWRHGDGVLLGAGLILLLRDGFLSGKVGNLWIGALFLLFALGQGYLFNDLYDAPRDLKNPKKDPRYVAFLLRHRLPLFYAHGAVVFLLVLFGFLLGKREGISFSLFYLLGLIYSFLFKRIPVLDLFWVGLWGASYLGIVTGDPFSLAVIALMTAISHLFQTEVDLAVDQLFQIDTSAGLRTFVKDLLLFSLCVCLFLLSGRVLPLPFSLLSFVPLLLYKILPPLPGWVMSKIAMGFLWIAIVTTPVDIYGIS